MATWPHQPERLVPRGDRPSITTHFHFNITCSEDRFPLTSSNLTWTPKKNPITLFTTHPPASIGAFLHRHHLRHYPRCTVQEEKTSRFWYSYDYKKNKSAGEYQHHSGNQKRKRERNTCKTNLFTSVAMVLVKACSTANRATDGSSGKRCEVTRHFCLLSVSP